MRVFITGSTGFIGTALIPELLKAGHQVLGLTRSDDGEKKLQKLGAGALRGNIEDLDSVRRGAEAADAVVHLAFNHEDFGNRYLQSCAEDRAAIQTIGEALEGTNRPFLMTSGTAIAQSVDGRPAAEDSPVTNWNPRSQAEALMQSFTSRGVRTGIVRLPQVHDTRKQGLVPYLLAVAREKGVSAYIGEGGQRWPAAHVSAVAQLYRLALEKAEPGAIYHAVDEEGVTLKAIAEAHGRGLKIPVVSIPPEEVESHFGWLAMFANLDMTASSAITQQKLGWTPTGPSMIEDLDAMDYTQA